MADKFQELHDKFALIMSEYGTRLKIANETKNYKDKFKYIIMNDIKDLLTSCVPIESPYTVKGSVGFGGWAYTPWIAIFDTNITTGASNGFYIVYLLNSQTKELYLTFNQGSQNIIEENAALIKERFSNLAASKQKIALLNYFKNKIRSELDSNGFSADDNTHSASTKILKDRLYDIGSIFYKKYTLDDLPDGKGLCDDLNRMLDIYKKFYPIWKKYKDNPGKDDSPKVISEWVPALKEYTTYISKEQWKKLFKNRSIFTKERRTIIDQFSQWKDGVDFHDIASKVDMSPELLMQSCAKLAKDICDETGCEPYSDGEKSSYGSVLFLIKKIGTEQTSIWKLRPEIIEAWEEVSELPDISTLEMLEKIESYIAAKGFTYPEGMIRNFYLSLKSKPFVILAGTSGTGKTKLVKLFAEAIGAKYKMVSVRPDWSDSSDLFGHLDLNGKFVPGPVLPFLSEAQRNPHEPFILCLDEMNLARVEYYLSDVLSVIETREKDGNRIISDYLLRGENYGSDTVTAAKFGEIRFPENLFLVGTVNMDETTFPFSKKVLDRANTIEFDYVDLIPEFHDGLAVGEEPQKLPADFLKSNYLFLAQCEDREYVTEIGTKLQSMNEILQKAKLHVGYRVRDEISFYMLNNKNYGLLSEEEAFDNEIMQKVLPRIQGSSASVKDVLCDLFRKLTNLPYETESTKEGDISSKMLKALDKNIVKYPKSANKIAFMVRRFEEDGFTSYWL